MTTLRRCQGFAEAPIALIALILTIVLVISAPVWFRGSALSPLLGYLAVWVPLLGAVLVAIVCSRSVATGFGLSIRPIDLLWGIGVGLLLRVAAILIEITVYGRAAPAATLDDGWLLFTAVLPPTVIAPVVEELFFRGLLLRTLERLAGRDTVVAVSSTAFAARHLLTATTLAQLLVVGLSTFAFGVAAGALAVVTRRIGGAIIAHVALNAVVVVPGLF